MEKWAIVGDPGMGDEYLAQVIDKNAWGHDPPPWPMVKIIGILRYPDQRAIMPPHPAHEAPPLREGLICRLPILRPATAADRPLPREQALSRAIQEAGNEEEREILRRHAEGRVGGRRSIVEISLAQLDFMRRYCRAETGGKNDADH